MTDTPDLDIRRRVAAVLGWVDFATVGMDEELLMGVPPDAKNIYRVEVTPYEMSLDACLADAAPMAQEMGWYLSLAHDRSGWEAQWWRDDAPILGAEAIAETPATAFCLAFVAVMEGK